MTERTLTIVFKGRDEGLSAMGQKLSKDLGATADEADKTAKRFKELDGVPVEAKFKTMSSELGITRQQFDQLQKTVGTTTEGLVGLAAASGAVAAGIGGAATVSIREFAAFDNALTSFSAKSGIARDDLGGLEAQAVSLAAVTSQTPASVAALSTSLLSLGASAGDVEQNLEAITKLSDLVGEDPVLTGQVIQTGLNIFEKFGETSDGLADKLNKLINTTAAGSQQGIAEFFQLFSDAAPIAAEAGVGFDVLSASFATLRDNGLPASVAATGLKNALISLAAPTANAQKQLDSLGLSFSDFTDASGNLDFQAFIEALAVSLQDITDKDVRLEKLADIFGREAAPAVATLVGNVERLDENLNSVANSTGSVEEGLATLNQGFGRQIELLQGVISGLATEFGAVLAIGLGPLIQGANALVSGFLALPEPLKQAVLGVTAFTGALAGAIALGASFQALQATSTVQQTLNTAAILANTTAKQTAFAVETAYNTVKAITTASLSKENVLLAANTVATQAAAIAKNVFAIATGNASAATLVLAGRLATIAATAALAVGAFKAVSAAVGQFTAGADFGREFGSAIDELERGRGVVEETAISFNTTSDRLSKLYGVLRDRGPIEALQTVFVDLQEAITGVGDSTSRYGESITFLGKELGLVTQTQLANQRQQIALSEGIERLGAGVDGTIDLFNQYGQAIAGAERELSPQELEAFTAAARDQASALQEEIEVLESQKGVNAELDAQLQNEINVRQALIGQLEAKVAAQNGDSDSVKNSAEANRELSEVLDELKGKYGDIQAELDRDQAQDLAAIAEQQAAGLITEQQAQLQEAEVTRKAIEDRLKNNQALLADLRAQQAARAEAGKEEDAAALGQEILAVETEIAGDRQDLAQQQIDQAESVAEAEKEALEERFQQAEDAIARNQTLRERDALLLEQQLLASGASQEEIAEQTAQAGLDAERASIEEQIALQRQKVASYGEGTKEQAAASLELAQLENDLISNQIEQEKLLRDIQVRAIEEATERARIASDSAIAGIERQLDAQALIERSLERQADLLSAQDNLRQAAADLQSTLFDREIQQQQKVLDNENATAEEKQAAAQELFDLTLERTNAERRALLDQQAIEQQQLELEIERDRISAQRAIREEEIALKKLEFQRKELEAELQIAQIRGDTVGIEAAQAGLDNLDQQLALQRENIDAARQDAEAVDQLAGQRRQTLALTQANARVQFEDNTQGQFEQVFDSARNAGVNADQLAAVGADQFLTNLRRTTDQGAVADAQRLLQQTGLPPRQAPQINFGAGAGAFQGIPAPLTAPIQPALAIPTGGLTGQPLTQLAPPFGAGGGLSQEALVAAFKQAIAELPPGEINQTNTVNNAFSPDDARAGAVQDTVEEQVFGALTSALEGVRSRQRRG